MKKEYIEELEQLTPRQRRIVLSGLDGKLGLYKRKNILSYQYEVCPICKDVGSTLKDQNCDRCYISKSCKAPFNDGFKDDPKTSAAYFTEMQRILLDRIPPSVFVAGGTWDQDGGRSSKVVDMLAHEFNAKTINGGYISECWDDSLKHCANHDLVIWMPNISNAETKMYPKKFKGSALICSKVMREGYTKADAVARIFRMGANAVIEIRKNDGLFNFRLTDALGNTWADTNEIVDLTKAILSLYEWTKGSIRVGTFNANTGLADLENLMECTRKIADNVENSIGERYFGNIMTRCQQMFPGMRQTKSLALVSPRNSDKRRLEAEDMILVLEERERVMYWGSRKPSVDTPIQLAILKNNPKINYLIHGHAYIKEASITQHYYPCGDMREIQEILRFTSKHSDGAINLKNHGFLLFASDIRMMEKMVEIAKFIEPENFHIKSG